MFRLYFDLLEQWKSECFWINPNKYSALEFYVLFPIKPLPKQNSTSYYCVAWIVLMAMVTGLRRVVYQNWFAVVTAAVDMVERLLTHWPLGNLNEIFRHVIFRQNLVVGGWGISCEIALVWMSLDFTDDQSKLVQVMAWCRQATSHYMDQCWTRSLPPYGVTRPQWVLKYWTLHSSPRIELLSLEESCLVITRSNVTRFCVQHGTDNGWTRVWLGGVWLQDLYFIYILWVFCSKPHWISYFMVHTSFGCRWVPPHA